MKRVAATMLLTSIILAACAVWKCGGNKLVAYPPYRIVTDGKTATAEFGLGLAPVPITAHSDSVTSQTLPRKPFGFVR